MSTKNGAAAIFKDSEKIGGNTAQIFTSSPRQWNAKNYTESEISSYLDEKENYAGFTVFSHASYLINIASLDEKKRHSAIDAFTKELHRCGDLTIPYIVLHPGSFTGGTREDGITAIAKSLGSLIEIASLCSVQILLENTGGQGSYLGSTFDELAEIIKKTEGGREHLGICIDTCHAFVSGYDLRTDSEYERMITDIDKLLEIKRVKLWHLNDTDKELGSHSDRHADIGTGIIGLRPFELIVNDKRFKNTPKIVETPGDDEDHERNITTLRSLCMEMV